MKTANTINFTVFYFELFDENDFSMVVFKALKGRTNLLNRLAAMGLIMNIEKRLGPAPKNVLYNLEYETPRSPFGKAKIKVHIQE